MFRKRKCRHVTHTAVRPCDLRPSSRKFAKVGCDDGSSSAHRSTGPLMTTMPRLLKRRHLALPLMLKYQRVMAAATACNRMITPTTMSMTWSSKSATKSACWLTAGGILCVIVERGGSGRRGAVRLYCDFRCRGDQVKRLFAVALALARRSFLSKVKADI